MILKTSPDNFQGKDKENFEEVLKKTKNEKDKFHNNYKTAKEVKDNFLSNTNSKPAEN